MKKRTLQHSLLAGLVLLAGSMNAQDIHFSQFYMSPLTLNPALAGTEHNLSAALNFKDQWQSVSSPYKTMAFSYDMRFGNKNQGNGFFAAGINFFSDKAGDAHIGTTSTNLSVAYHVLVNSYNIFTAGVQGGFTQRSMSSSNLQWGTQYDGTSYDSNLPSGETNTTGTFSYADFAAGLAWNFNNAGPNNQVPDNHVTKGNFGLSVFHLSRPSYSFYNTEPQKLYMKYILHGNMLFGLPGTSFSLVPGLMYTLQGKQQEIFAGTLLRYSTSRQDIKSSSGLKTSTALSAGAYLRAKDALVTTVMLEYSNFALGVSYDINVSKLHLASNGKGSFEISLRYSAPNPFLFKNSNKFFY